MQANSDDVTAESGESRWELIRDVLAFQVKLLLDALRDILLSPVSIAAALVDLFSAAERPRRSFYRLLELGRRSDAWINLFGEAERSEADDAAQSVDALVGHVEKLVVSQYERGGVTASAKSAIDKSLDSISRRRRR